MVGLLFLAMMGVAVAFAAFASFVRKSEDPQTELGEAASQLGIDPWQHVGHIEGFTVRISEREVVLEGIDPAIDITRASSGNPGLRTGDETFDSAFRITGAVTFAALHPAARKNWLEHADLPDLRASSGAISARIPLLDTKTITGIAQHLVQLARVLHFEGTAEQRLAGLAHFDTLSGVRRHALEVLCKHPGADAARNGALEAALGDADPGVRIFAAKCLGERGWEALEGLVTDTKVDDAHRAEALSACSALPPPRRRTLLDRVCDAETGPRTRGAAVDLLAGLAMDAPFVEGALLRIVHIRNPEEVFARAAELLGRVGSARSVETLIRLRDSFQHSYPVHHAAGNAIRAIQDRLAGADAGQLTIANAADPVGALSPVGREGDPSGLPETAELPAVAVPRKQTT